jgi:flagellar biosynthesis/type III secretory pathway protein FliH
MASYRKSTSELFNALVDAKEIFETASREAEQLRVSVRRKAALWLHKARARLKHRAFRQQERVEKSCRALLEIYFFSRCKDLLREIQEEALTLSLKAVEQLIEGNSEYNRKALAALLAQGLSRLIEMHDVVVSAQAQEIPAIQGALEALFPGKSVAVTPRNCEKGSIFIQAPAGTIELNWREALEAFRRHARGLLCREGV